MSRSPPRRVRCSGVAAAWGRTTPDEHADASSPRAPAVAAVAGALLLTAERAALRRRSDSPPGTSPQESDTAPIRDGKAVRPCAGRRARIRRPDRRGARWFQFPAADRPPARSDESQYRRVWSDNDPASPPPSRPGSVVVAGVLRQEADSGTPPVATVAAHLHVRGAASRVTNAPTVKGGRQAAAESRRSSATGTRRPRRGRGSRSPEPARAGTASLPRLSHDDRQAAKRRRRRYAPSPTLRLSSSAVGATSARAPARAAKRAT